MKRSEQRREPRYVLEAEALIERASGEKVPASTINVSGGGLLLLLNQPLALELGEVVTCGLRLYAGKPLQSWGTGRVVRLSGSCVAIDFQAAAVSGSSDPPA